MEGENIERSERKMERRRKRKRKERTGQWRDGGKAKSEENKR